MLVVVVDTSTAAVTAALVEVSAAAPASAGEIGATGTAGGNATAARDGAGAAGTAGGNATGSTSGIGAAGTGGGTGGGSATRSTSGVGAVGIGAGVEVVAERVSVDGRAHAELLAPAIAGILADAKAGPGDLVAVVAGLGPGPFTGLRVGLVTAAALGHALAIPTYGVCSLDGIGARTEGLTLVATDARRKEVYWAAYSDGVRIAGPAVHRPADVAAELAAAGIAVTGAAGDGAQRYARELGVPVPGGPQFPVALALAELAADRVRAGAAGELLTPLYLRRPDAVEPARPKAVRT